MGEEKIAEIGSGMVVLLGVGEGDEEHDVEYMTEKIANLRIFEDDKGKMNLSLLETGGEALVVSQFTLYGDCRKGRRPAFNEAAAPEMGEQRYEQFVKSLRLLGVKVSTGIFRAHMTVEIVNDGPVTILLDSRKQF